MNPEIKQVVDYIDSQLEKRMEKIFFLHEHYEKNKCKINIERGKKTALLNLKEFIFTHLESPPVKYHVMNFTAEEIDGIGPEITKEIKKRIRELGRSL